MDFNRTRKVHKGFLQGLYGYVRVEKFVTEVCHLLDVLIPISDFQLNLHGQCMDKICHDGNMKLDGDFVQLFMQIAEVSNAALGIFGPP